MTDDVEVEVLGGKFLFVGDIQIINLDRLIKATKFDYIPERNRLTLVKEGEELPLEQYCILFLSEGGVTEVVSFLERTSRDIAFLKIKVCMRGF